MIYLDHAATTPLAPEVLEAMRPWLTAHYGNPSSVHRLGREARGAVEDARRRVARHLNAEPSELLFTSGGTESDNLALRGLVPPGAALVTGTTEHEAILATADALEAEGRRVVRLDPGPAGGVTAEAVARALATTPDVALVSLLHANNETGALTDLPAIAEVCHAHSVPFHTDAVQTAGLFSLDVQALGVSLLSASAHKFYGPCGAGLLYVRAGAALSPQVTGGKQERSRRAGTENVAAIVGLAAALDLAARDRADHLARLTFLRARLLAGLQSALGDTFVVNTPLGTSAPHVLNVAFPPTRRRSMPRCSSSGSTSKACARAPAVRARAARSNPPTSCSPSDCPVIPPPPPCASPWAAAQPRRT